MYPQAKEQIECGHVVKEESVVIQSKEKEATRSVANIVEVKKISHKDETEIPLSSTELSVQEIERKSDIIGKTIADLKLESYSKDELIKVIEFSLFSYVEGAKQVCINHPNRNEDSSLYAQEVRTGLLLFMDIY